MEEKKYEAGKVEISSAEYRDLIKEMVEAQRDASEARSEKWRLESEKSKLSQELEAANKKIAELESILSTLQVGVAYSGTTPNTTSNPCKPWWSEVTCLLNNKEGN
jgi:predicted  nucleic acid-binding Zn-ribbon protein